MILMGLAMAFTTALLVANIIAGKIISIGDWSMSAGIIAYPLTFLLTDAISEVYGRKATTRVVWFGFACSLLMLLLIYIGKALPLAGDSLVNQESYDNVLGNVPRIVFASMVAYLVAQNHDVFAFHFWRRKTGGRHLWFRNNASTAVSQLMDTALFTSIAFWGMLPVNVMLSIFVVEYIAKVVISVVDTPLVYALVGAVRKYGGADARLGLSPGANAEGGQQGASFYNERTSSV